MRRAPRSRAAAALTLALAALLALAGCEALRGLSPSARRDAEVAAAMLQLQARDMRFADYYVGRLIQVGRAVEGQMPDPDHRYQLSGWLLAQANAAYTAASSEHAQIGTLDLITLATLSHKVVERIGPQRFPGQAQALIAVHRELETEAWRLAEGVLDTQQQSDLRRLIADWQARNPDFENASFIRFQDFLKVAPASAQNARLVPASLMGIVGLDPLAGLDPAVKQVEQTRLLADRAIYYAQRVPIIMDLQLDRSLNRLATGPEAQRLLANGTSLSTSAERFVTVAEALPADFAREREAIIRQLSEMLSTQQATLLPMLVELRTALEAGRGTAGAVDEAARSIDALVARFQDRPRTPGEPPGRPFDITEYTQAATEITRAAHELTRLMNTVGVQAPGLGGAVGSTLQGGVAQGRVLVDYLFVRVAWLIALLLGGLLAVLLLYRWLAPRIRSS